MDKETIEFIAKLPELPEIGIAYIDYLRLRLFVKTGAIVITFLPIMWLLVHLLKLRIRNG